MNVDIEKLKDFAEKIISEHGVGELSPVPGVVVPASHARSLITEIEQLRAENAELQAKCVALGRYVSIGRRQKSQYFRAVKWFLANTNISPADVPTPVYHTLVHVVNTLAAKAKRAAAEVANG
ncbi:hypothetical protein [Pseudomonas monteilii]|uniref:hypothetical protein n=1 Tax=Pseudomonas monteilii TaxID=76759 RepID=UPI001E348726|nr:hypothetical protein [Pseudomonas monteilii]MCE0931650.1 hypothetical protein [Pseudomonas monteilii]MCE1007480.1 hypothetical protein [Pseudomonas monteilii]WJN90192.1 hypothetical protein LU680_09885 [Pseudomonas monteilii]WJO34804.1 hypothetical protein LU690_08560 [Pseudomonas monteilii]WJR41149.1 hypothetical protein LU662_009135 [Pseudomonas monteilii]